MSKGYEPTCLCRGVTVCAGQEDVTHIRHFTKDHFIYGNGQPGVERLKGHPDALLGLSEPGKKLGWSTPRTCRVCRKSPAELGPELQGKKTAWLPLFPTNI